ncbi:MAG: PQQ-dependent sugar dehydrogenase [Verrucomicrobiota bacterium]
MTLHRLFHTFLLFASYTLTTSAQNAPSSPDPQRSPWTTSRIQGSPEVPLPYSSEAVFQKLQFSNALEMISIGDRLVVVERGGKIWSFPQDLAAEKADLLIDLKSLHPKMTFAYGIAFHPQWKTKKEVFITYTLANGLEDGTHLSRFRLKDGDIPQLDPDSEEILLTWLSGGHNGANLRFGPDGMLYISTGDAAVPSPPDILNSGQDNSDLLCAILRIDINHSEKPNPYVVPKDNPYFNVKNVRPEVWAFGFRNPWKMSFGPKGKLWVGDVGWELWEMIHLVDKGHNAGWSAMESSNPIKPETASPLAPITAPLASHPHTEASSITGGYVYQGTRLPELKGAYIYGDYTSGKIWALWHDGQKITRHEEIADTPHRISTFGQDQDGELYYIDYATPSGIYRLIPNPKAGKKSDFPQRLSETGLFTDTPKQTPAPGVYPYDIIEPMWQDGANSQRFIALPDKNKINTTIEYHADQTIRRSTVTWPIDTVLAKTISTGAPSHHKIETQILHYDGESWNGYSYRWNKNGSDADLVVAKGEEVPVPEQGWQGGTRYQIHSRSQCSRCHNSWNKYVLGFQPWQLKSLPHSGNPSIRESAITLGLLDSKFFERNTRGLLTSSHGRGSTNQQARSWLHANCSACHRRHGGGSAPLEVNFEVPLMQAALLYEKPTRGDFGLDDASVIVPGSPTQSALLYRITSTGSAHMPLIGPREVDAHAETLITKWINELPHANQQTDGNIEAGLSSPSNAMKMIAKINSGELSDAQRKSTIDAGLASSNANINALFLRFLSPDERPRTLGSDIDVQNILQLTGNAKHGAQILSTTGKWAACYACHRINELGGKIGPDLTKVATRLNKQQILDSLLTPSKTINPEFQAWQIELSDEKTLTAFIIKQDKKQLTLRLVDGSTKNIAKTKIKNQSPLPTSLMPEGLLQTLTQQEAADVLEWLSTLK